MLNRALLIAFALVLGLFVFEPQLRQFFYAANEPRAVAARGALADFEQTAIALFERVSPSVVQVVVPRGGAAFAENEGEPGQAGAGTGFVWDDAGNIITNAHVVGTSDRVMIRTAAGNVMSAQVVGRAPNQDLAVVRLSGRGSLPPPVA